MITITLIMYYSYPSHDSNTQVQYVRNKIGNNYFIVYYKNAARFCFSPKEVGRVFGVAKFTPGVNAIRDWAKEMVEKYDKEVKGPVSIGDDYVAIDKEGGFGPECHDDEKEPQENTKMIV